MNLLFKHKPAISLSSLQIDYSSPQAKGLVCFYPMNEGGGATAYDKVVNNNASLVNSPTWNAGRNGSTLKLNGSSQYASIPDSPLIQSIASNRKITQSIWIKWNASTESYNQFFGKYSSTTLNGFVFYLKSNQQIAWYLNNSAGFIDGGGSTIPFGKLTLLTATYDGSTAKIYINGVLNQSASMNVTIGGDTIAVTIGHDQYGSGRYFNGEVSDARLYNRALSAAEVQDIYINPLSIFKKQYIQIANLLTHIGYWDATPYGNVSSFDATTKAHIGSINNVT